jgi:glycerophosphoryl diester phosphodiesterase
MEIELLLVGGETTGLSYDNMTVNSAGSVLLQEDRAGASPLIFANQRRYARVLAFDPVSSSSTFLFEANQAGIDPGSANDYGNWETSGIIEVAFDPENGQSWYALTIQAHSLSDPDYIQGGQLVLIYPVVSNGFLPSTFSP